MKVREIITESRVNEAPAGGYRLVRVVDGLDNIQTNGDGSLTAIARFNGHSQRNTLHFTVNSMVGDHNMGKFPGKYVIIANPAEMPRDQAAGARAEDTWYRFNNEGEINLGRAIVLAPKGSSVPNGIKAQYYKGDRSTAIDTAFKQMNVGFHGVAGTDAVIGIRNDEYHKDFSTQYGTGATQGGQHDGSLEGYLESIPARLQGYLGHLQKSIHYAPPGERETYVTSYANEIIANYRDDINKWATANPQEFKVSATYFNYIIQVLDAYQAIFTQAQQAYNQQYQDYRTAEKQWKASNQPRPGEPPPLDPAPHPRMATWPPPGLNLQIPKIQLSYAKKNPQGVAEGLENNNTTAQKIFFARSNKTPKGWSYDHVGFITQDGRQIQMSGHKGNDVYVTNQVTDDPEFPKQNIKIVSLSKPVSVPTTNSVGAENCGTFVANVLQANGIKGIDTQYIYGVFKTPHEPGVAEAVDIGQEWLSDTELDQYVPHRLQQQWRELLGYDRNGNPSALWANLTGGYEPDVRDPEHRALMVKVANKWFAAKKIPNVKFFDVRDADDELEWLVQIGQPGVAEATGDERFDAMMGQIQREPTIPDSQMPPTDVKDLHHWAVKNHKPYHKIFATWANREGFRAVAPALQKAGNLDSDALDYWTPEVWKIWYGPDSEMPRAWSKKRVPDELRDYLETVFDAYDRIVFDWPTEYRKIGQQGVAEAFDQPYSFEWEEGEDSEAVDALATLGDGTYLSIMFSKEFGDYGDDLGDWSIEFHRNNSQEVTGEGDAQKVFATVLEAIRQFVKKYKANTITFSASKALEPDMVKPGANANPESRAKLYNRLVQRYAGAMGYSATQREGNGKVTYTLRQTKPGVAEGTELPGDFNLMGQNLFLKNLARNLQQRYPNATVKLSSDRVTAYHNKEDDEALSVMGTEVMDSGYIGVGLDDAFTESFQGVLVPTIKQTTEQLLAANPGTRPALFLSTDNWNPDAWTHIANKLGYRLVADDESLNEFAQQADVRAVDNAIAAKTQPPAKMPASMAGVLRYLVKGDWRSAIMAGALTMVPELQQHVTPEQYKVLKYAVNTYGAVNFWQGLSAFASRLAVPFMSLAGYSGDLNQGEQSELARRRQMGASQ